MSAAHAEARFLKLTLHGRLVGFVSGSDDGRNILTFADGFASDDDRPTFSLTTHPNFPRAKQVLSTPKVRHRRLYPVLSNLLPEGSMREMNAQALKVHVDDEFKLLSCLGGGLTGAVIATPMDPGEVPGATLTAHGNVVAVETQIEQKGYIAALAGIQTKFSGQKNDRRYNIARGDARGEWIIKTPSTIHGNVPLNEYSAMSLASLAGVEIPEIELVEVESIDDLPPINLPDEQWAYSVKRFDRNGPERVHTEDFAQVLLRYPDMKYDSKIDYAKIGRLVYRHSGDGLGDVQQMARRLLVNILLANGDAHLKNWSLVYPDRATPRLAPAYDILTTKVYSEGESEFALKLGNEKEWYAATTESFERWAGRADIPWRAVKPHLLETLEMARSAWPDALKDLPMDGGHKRQLVDHWGRLQQDFMIKP